MTENDAKQWLKHTRAYQHKCDNCEYIDIKGACNEECKDFYDMAIQALEEIQQYRAIGTPTQIYKKIGGLDVELGKYHSIGTIDEFKALKEKNEPKKILYRKQSYGTPWLCPYCEADQIKVEFFSEDGSEPKEKYTFCWQCGTRIDWSE